MPDNPDATGTRRDAAVAALAAGADAEGVHGSGSRGRGARRRALGGSSSGGAIPSRWLVGHTGYCG